jgi:hypothetical protein
VSDTVGGHTVCEVPDQPRIVAAGAIVELQAPQEPSSGRHHRFSVSDGSDRLAVTARLFAETSDGQRLVAPTSAMAIGLWRHGPEAISKRYLGPPPLPQDPDEQEQFLSQYRLRHRDVADAVNQMLGRDPEQHRPPRLSWDTLIQVLPEHGFELTEERLIALPFCCQLAPAVEAELSATKI